MAHILGVAHWGGYRTQLSVVRHGAGRRQRSLTSHEAVVAHRVIHLDGAAERSRFAWTAARLDRHMVIGAGGRCVGAGMVLVSAFGG